jgi:hypothetical protein
MRDEGKMGKRKDPRTGDRIKTDRGTYQRNGLELLGHFGAGAKNQNAQ